MRRIIVICAIATVCAICACSRQESAWEHAEREDSIAAYKAYLEQFPAGAHASDARARADALEDDAAWARANRLGTPEAWQRYLGERPQGRHAGEARRRLAELVPPPARAPAATAGIWAVQFGAFLSEAAARAELDRVLREHGETLGAAAPRVLAPSSELPGIWRVRAGPLPEPAARESCARLQAEGVSCVALPDLEVEEAPT